MLLLFSFALAGCSIRVAVRKKFSILSLKALPVLSFKEYLLKE